MPIVPRPLPHMNPTSEDKTKILVLGVQKYKLKFFEIQE